MAKPFVNTRTVMNNSDDGPNGEQGGLPKMKDRSEYEVAADLLNESMRDLGVVIDELSQRLIPVMQPGPKDDCPDKPGDVPNDSQIVRHILDQARRARGYNDRIKELLGAMQI